MAIFTLNIDPLAPTYMSGGTTASMPEGQPCAVNADTNYLETVSFDTGTSTFRMGVNYVGAAIQTIKIISFAELEYSYNQASPSTTILQTVEAGTESFIENTAVTVTIFPLLIDESRINASNIIDDFGVRIFKNVGCPTGGYDSVKRERIITYSIIDVNGTEGPQEEVSLTVKRELVI